MISKTLAIVVYAIVINVTIKNIVVMVLSMYRYFDDSIWQTVKHFGGQLFFMFCVYHALVWATRQFRKKSSQQQTWTFNHGRK